MKIFIDASVILAALGSKSGGSSLVLQLKVTKKVVSQSILEEVFRNTFKVGYTREEVNKLLVMNDIDVFPAPSSEEARRFFRIVGEKDAHVIASTLSAKAEIIVTLDKKHLLSKKIKGLEIITPGELLQKFTSGL